MTITEILAKIHELIENNRDYPEVGSEDFNLRLTYVNQAINAWESEKGMVWNELFSNHSFTMPTGESTGTLPATFLYPAGYVLVYPSTGGTPTTFTYKRPEKDQLEELENSGSHTYFLTLDSGVKTLNFRPTPTIINSFAGLSAKLPYYHTATYFTTGEETTPIEMSDPWFAIYWTLMMLHLEGGNTTQGSIMSQIQKDKMDNMRIKNEIVPFWQNSQLDNNYLPGWGI